MKALVLFMLLLPILLLGSVLYFFINQETKNPSFSSSEEPEMTPQNSDRNWTDVPSERHSIKKSKRKVDDRTWRNNITKEIRFYDGNEDRKAIEKIYKGGLLISAKSWKPNGEKCPETNISDGSGIVVDYRWGGTRWFRHTYKNGLPIFE